MAIIFSPFSADQIKKMSEAVERKIWRRKSSHIVLVGICLLSISPAAFLFSYSFVGTESIRGYDLVFRYKLKMALGFFFLHILAFLVLVLPGLIDKFRYATLFVFLSILLLLGIYFFEAPRYIPGFPDSNGSANESVISFIMLLQCWILFGLETYKTKSRNSLFVFVAFINDKIQYFYDEYAMLDYRKAIGKFKARHKK